jgi:cell filamentation protein, protein adenylyltransferase
MDDVRRRTAVKKAELDDLRPTAAKTLAALSSWYDVELTYTSNAIEGNTLTRMETALVLERGVEGLTISGKPIKDHLEVVGHHDALGYVRALAGTAEPVREVDVRAIHRLVMERVEPAEAGKYSDHERFIKGSSVVLPSPWELAPLMSDFGQWLSRTPASPECAFDAHARLVTIHPFSDGNGRTARLLMNLLLMKDRYPPVVIGPEHRVQYFDSLQKLQTESDGGAYMEFMYGRLEASLDYHLAVLKRSQPKNTPSTRESA